MTVTGAPADPVPAPALPDNLRPYYDKIVRYLEVRLRWPFARNGRQGKRFTVIVHLVSDQDGHVLLAELQKSSGYDDLDQEAVAAAKRSDPFPAMPADAKHDRIDIAIPVMFVFRPDGSPSH